MTTQRDIRADLDQLVKNAADITAAALSKSASTGDPLDSDNGTSAPETGHHMEENIAEAGKHTAAKADGGAHANEAGASVTKSTDGATAGSTDGQSGAQGADLDVKDQAANGPEGGLEGKPSELDEAKTASAIEKARKTAAALFKTAGEVPEELKEYIDDDDADDDDDDDKMEKDAAKAKLAAALGKTSTSSDADAAAELGAFRGFLAKCAAVRNPQVKTAMEGGDMQPAEAADAEGQAMLEALASGQISEEQAEQILVSAIEDGAISPEDLEELQALESEMAAAPAETPEGMVEDPMLEQKVAAASIGPDHPQYVQKLASLHGDAVQFGYDLFHKMAEEMVALAEEDETTDEPAPEEVVAAMSATPDGESAPEVVAEPSVDGEAEADPMAEIMPGSPEEEQALQEVLAEMGMTPDQMQELQAAEMPKTASYKDRLTGAILTKAAALGQLAGSTDNKE